MENIVIGIVSGNASYCKALGFSLMSVCDDFIIKYYDTRHFISEWNSYQGEGDFNERFDLILWDGKEMEDSYGGNLILLAEKASMVRKDFTNKRFSLYKYCSAAALAAALFEIYTCLTGRGTVFIPKDSVSLFAFGSWDGGCGCTTITLAVAQELCRFAGDRVLVISLETIESTPKHFVSAPDIKSIGEYLYRALPEESLTGDRTMPFIESYIVKDLYGVEAFAPSKTINPLTGLGETEIQKLIASLIDGGRYDAILIDMGTCLTKAALAVMEMANRICFVTRSHVVTHREEMYLGHVVFCVGEEVMGKSIRLTNLCRNRPDTAAVQESEPFLNAKAYVRSYEGAAQDSEPEQLILEGAFGEDIRKLAGQLLE